MSASTSALTALTLLAKDASDVLTVVKHAQAQPAALSAVLEDSSFLCQANQSDVLIDAHLEPMQMLLQEPVFLAWLDASPAPLLIPATNAKSDDSFKADQTEPDQSAENPALLGSSLPETALASHAVRDAELAQEKICVTPAKMANSWPTVLLEETNSALPLQHAQKDLSLTLPMEGAQSALAAAEHARQQQFAHHAETTSINKP